MDIEPENSGAQEWTRKGRSLRDIGNYREALTCYDKAIKISPGYATAWHNKGNALGALGRYEDELACYNIAIKIQPRNPDIWNNRGSALHFLKSIKNH